MKGIKVYEVSFIVLVREMENQLVEEDVLEQEIEEFEGEVQAQLESSQNLDAAIVTRVIDADTIEVELNGNLVDVRLLLVDAPETVHPDLPAEPFGAEAVIFAKEKLLGKQVHLEYDGPKYDVYGRLLAYVWIDGEMFNLMLLEKGLAHVAYVYDPPYKYYDRYLVAQTRGKNERKGIWGMRV